MREFCAVSASFAIIRGGILDHLVRGRVGLFELGLYTVVHLQADFSTGIWWGSAPRLVGSAPRGTSLRDVQRGLETLKDCSFLRPFHIEGKRGNYPVLIHKYDVRIGAQKGKRLNAWKSLSWEKRTYEVCAEDVAESVAEDAPYQYSVDSNQEKEKPAAQKSVPLHGRHHDCYEAAFEGFRKLHGAQPTWNGRDQKNLKTLLCSNPNITPSEFSKRWAFYLASTQKFIVEQGHSLAFFCSRFDSFLEGPILTEDRSGGHYAGGRDSRKRGADADVHRRNFTGLGLDN